MKTYVLTISKKFFFNPLKGQPTYFAEKIKAGTKIHTIRQNYDFWFKRVEQINQGNAVLSVREWSDKPYRSKQVELFSTSKVGIQKLVRDPFIGWFVDNYDSDVKTSTIAENDGLKYPEFLSWFNSDIGIDQELAIIHFTDFRYPNSNTVNS